MLTTPSRAVMLLLLTAVSVHVQAVDCDASAALLKSKVSTLKGCKAEHQVCLNMGPTNPMRELNYCRNLLTKCESLDGPIDDAVLRQEVEKHRDTCS